MKLVVDLDGGNLAKQLNSEAPKEQRSFVENFLAGLNPENYHCACKFVTDNPDESVECPKCKHRTLKLRDGLCPHCRAVLP